MEVDYEIIKVENAVSLITLVLRSWVLLDCAGIIDNDRERLSVRRPTSLEK